MVSKQSNSHEIDTGFDHPSLGDVPEFTFDRDFPPLGRPDEAVVECERRKKLPYDEQVRIALEDMRRRGVQVENS